MIETFRGEQDAIRSDMGEVMAENTLMREEIAAIKTRIEDMARWAATKGKLLPDLKG